jgi:hypothetical protein
MFYLVCFNCDLILIEHRNKHIVTFFWTIGTHCNLLTSDWQFGCKVVLSAIFLKSDTGKNYKTSFNCDLILIEHRNKHIVTFFWTIGTDCNFLTSDRHFGCKVVLSAIFLKSDTEKKYKTSKKTDKVIPTCLFMQMT